MRIVSHVASLERLGGIEVNTLEATRALAARGHEVHVFHGPPLEGGTAPDMREAFERAGVVLHGPHPFASPTPRQALTAVRSYLPAASLVARLRPDVVWLQRFEHVVWGQTVARRSRTPLVCHLHNAPNYGHGRLPLLSHGVARFAAVSEFTRREWVAAGLRQDLVDVLPNAVPADGYPVGGEPEREAARRALGLPPDGPLALYYGRLAEAKGVAVLLDAWEQLSPRAAGAQLVLAGEFPASGDDDLRSRVARLAGRGDVTVLPAQPDVVPLLHAADVVVFPSLLPEAFGRVALEAVATGRPVLASAIGAVPEVLSGPLSRLLVPPSDPAALAARLGTVLSWRQDEPGLGALCRAEALGRFSFDDYVSRVEDLLQSAAERRSPRLAG
jgi:glycosyltransferase involved in cell wall biosynthesis